jgi:hypothetical protein
VNRTGESGSADYVDGAKYSHNSKEIIRKRWNTYHSKFLTLIRHASFEWKCQYNHSYPRTTGIFMA